jgi:eukaryotic-like serine/threonine-protein kinase
MSVTTAFLPPRYESPQRIGRGGMGEIFRATDSALGRPVAIKVLDARFAQDERVRARFKREALAVARLSGNPHIVTIYDVGEWRGRPFIVMEYLAGGSVEERLERDGPPPLGEALDWLEQAARALDAAHREGIVHRDVKPANLLLDRHDRVHVADFGIASAAGLASLTQTGTVLGTAAYLAPEQAMGERTTPASDVYALGVVAFELLTGRRPFEGGSAAAEAAAHVTSEIPSVCGSNPELPCELDPVFERVLAKDPSARFASCAELVASLRDSIERSAGTTAVRTPVAQTAATGTLPPPRTYERRRRDGPLPYVIGVVALGLVGVVLAAVLANGGSSPQPSAAARQSVSVRTVTEPGTTVVTTATSTLSAAAPPSTTAAPPATQAVTGDPAVLNDRAWALMQQGRYSSALPLLESAVFQLRGQSTLTNAYANYNLGVTLMRLGRCAEAMPYLETSRSLQPQRREVKDAIKEARGCGG